MSVFVIFERKRARLLYLVVICPDPAAGKIIEAAAVCCWSVWWLLS